ncbi:hypothetical protein SH668x_000828 [Planctomicrobium sp. SH668]|uniref:hypothetical protein n=1 Tax=Planctomicrobium sp. SH668 TaxID=3448126 RepID=UPI003F5AF670
MTQSTAGKEIEQSIEQLTQRFTALNTKKIQAETKLEKAQEQLAELKKEAREKYGTDDAEALQLKLDQMQSENQQKRADYQSQLDKIEADLVEIEQQFNARENPPHGEGIR